VTALDSQLERLAETAAASAPAKPKRMLLIANPHATTMSDRLRHLAVHALRSRYEVEAIDTQRKGHAIEICREAATEGYDLVVAFGGDGTVNEAANGLVGSGTPLSCLPGGSSNVFARILGIPNDVVDATEHLLGMADRFRPRPVDLGALNGRWFTFSAGVGIDASVVERVDRHPHLKARFGSWYFAQSAITTFLRRYVVAPPRLELTAGGRTHAGVSAVVQNARPFTFFKDTPIDVAEGAALDSGDLSGVVLTRANPLDTPALMYRLLSPTARVADHRRIEHFRDVDEIRVRVTDGRPVPVEVDGEHIGDELDVRFTVAPGALTAVS
jgi:diacylglycerol kinase family enzyme